MTDIKNHAFYKDIQFDELNRSQIKAPFLPPMMSRSCQEHDSFHDLMKTVRKREWVDVIPECQTKMFDCWYVAKGRTFRTVLCTCVM